MRRCHDTVNALVPIEVEEAFAIDMADVASSSCSLRNTIRLAEGLYVLQGAVNTGALIVDGAALLFDCCETVTDQRLAELGVEGGDGPVAQIAVEQILCTQHRRPNVAGAYRYVARGAEGDQIAVVPRGERHLFEEVDAYWSDPGNRWHIYHHQPQQVLARPLAQYEFDLKMEVLGEMIRAVRKERHLTQEQLGELVGVKKSQISKLERSTKNVTIETILKVFHALKANVKFSIQMESSEVKIA